MTEKLLPEQIPLWHMPFWESAKEHAVRVQKCSGCGAFRYVPKEICAKCHSVEWTWEPISGEGTVYTHTVVRRAPSPAYDAPYAIVHVDMAEGFRMAAKLNGDPETVEIGMPVKVAYEALSPEWTVVVFEAA